jgi:transposase
MARRRFEMHEYRQALVRMRQGDSDRQIASARVMGRPLAAKLRSVAAERGWLDPQTALPEDLDIAGALGPVRRAATTVSTLEERRAQIEAWVVQGVSGVVIHAALRRDHGFTGSYSSVRRIVADIRAGYAPETTIRLSFEPGEAAQVDFGAGPMLADPQGVVRRTWAFVMTLAFSRHQYVEFVFDQSVPTWLGCHRRAFEWFGAVPQRVIIDNPKCAITRACARDPLVQRAYADCAEGYRFRIDPCPPADPQKKGIVESGVKYVKGNFLPLRSFRDLTDLNAQARSWVIDEAGQRCHGSTREAPLALFNLERSLMTPLPPSPPDLGSWHNVRVHRDCHIQHERILYSAPFALVGKTLWLHATDNAVALYEDFRHLATHRRGRRPGERITVPDHLPPHAAAFLAHDRQWCLAQAQAIGPGCHALIEHLLADRILERLRAAQAVLRLVQPYGAARLERACARAAAHGSFYYRTVKTILAGGHDLLPDPSAAAQPGALHGRDARFARDAASLFTEQPGRLH